MAIDNQIHEIFFSRKWRSIYSTKYTWDSDQITLDTEVYTADKTHDIIKV